MENCSLVGMHCQPKWMDNTPASRPGYCCKPSVSAAFSTDRSQISLRFVNPSNTSSAVLNVELPGGEAAGWKLLSVDQLAHSDLADANPMNDTMHISPKVAKQVGSNAFLVPLQSI